MFCVFAACYMVCMVVQSFLTTWAIASSRLKTSLISMNIMSIFHGIVFPCMASVTRGEYYNSRHMICFLINVMLLCPSSCSCMYDSRL